MSLFVRRIWVVGVSFISFAASAGFALADESTTQPAGATAAAGDTPDRAIADYIAWIDRTRETLEGAKDADSAKAAGAKLEGAGAEARSLIFRSRAVIAKTVAPAGRPALMQKYNPRIHAALEKLLAERKRVLADPTLAEPIRPNLDAALSLLIPRAGARGATSGPASRPAS